VSPAVPVTDVAALVAAMTLTEKCSLTTGADNWHSAGLERLGIPPVKMTDGPNGARVTRRAA
jgi:beta-glucosidase